MAPVVGGDGRASGWGRARAYCELEMMVLYCSRLSISLSIRLMFRMWNMGQIEEKSEFQ